MSNAKLHFEVCKRKGMPDREAFFAVIDHFNSQHWHDRNRYGEEIKQLKAEIERLREQVQGNQNHG